MQTLRAEEEPWLPEVFVPTAGYLLMAAPQSALILGESGAGKTAVLRQIAHDVSLQSGAEAALIVRWQPQPLDLHGASESEWVRQWTQRLLSHVGRQLLEWILRSPQAWQGAPSWVQQGVTSFIQAHPSETFMLDRLRWQSEAPAELQDWLQTLSGEHELVSMWRSQTAPQLLATLLNVLKPLSIAAIWALVDGLEQWLDQESQLEEQLLAFLSALALFEQSGFVFKIAAPRAWKNNLRQATAVQRRRVEMHTLHWHPDELHHLAQLRIAHMFARPEMRLEDLSAELPAWLQKHGGVTPRGWLSWVRLIAPAYLQQGGDRPLEKMAWQQLLRQHPPRLHIDSSDRVWVGPREITGLTQTQKAIMAHLYENPDRVCSRLELFYRAVRGLKEIPRRGEPGHEEAETIQHNMDTWIWELRQAIEPDPKHPQYIITVRRQGVRLARTY